jgi:hypothetical protein
VLRSNVEQAKRGDEEAFGALVREDVLTGVPREVRIRCDGLNDDSGRGAVLRLISSRYEGRSLIVSSNKTFSAGAESFGDPVAVAAMVDCLVHHAEVIVLKGDSYRLRGSGRRC